MSLFIADPKLRAERLKICEACEFYKKETKSCGTLIIGGKAQLETVDLPYRAKGKLCGCYMPVKTKFKFSECSLPEKHRKWHRVGLNVKEHGRLKALASDISKISGSINTTDPKIVELYSLISKLKGKHESPTTCGSCFKELLNEINNLKE